MKYECCIIIIILIIILSVSILAQVILTSTAAAGSAMRLPVNRKARARAMRLGGLIVGSFILFTEGGPAGKKDKAPPAGWCADNHRPSKPAQSGYKGLDGKLYCKACLRQKFPKLYEEKQKGRKSACAFCRQKKELVGGVCKPCRSARECDQCHEVNEDIHAPRCTQCSKRREALGAVAEKLALWCRDCATQADREKGYCRGCQNKYGGLTCYNCKVAVTDFSHRHTCAEPSCALVFYLCGECKCMEMSGAKLQCRTCWSRTNEVCIACGVQKARNHLDKFRCCWA